MVSTAPYQRQRRADLKKKGYRQMLMTFDPEMEAAIQALRERTGRSRTHILRDALFAEAALHNIDIPTDPFQD